MMERTFGEIGSSAGAKKGDPARFDTLPTSPKGRKKERKKNVFSGKCAAFIMARWYKNNQPFLVGRIKTQKRDEAPIGYIRAAVSV